MCHPFGRYQRFLLCFISLFLRSCLPTHSCGSPEIALAYGFGAQTGAPGAATTTTTTTAATTTTTTTSCKIPGWTLGTYPGCLYGTISAVGSAGYFQDNAGTYVEGTTITAMQCIYGPGVTSLYYDAYTSSGTDITAALPITCTNGKWITSGSTQVSFGSSITCLPPGSTDSLITFTAYSPSSYIGGYAQGVCIQMNYIDGVIINTGQYISTYCSSSCSSTASFTADGVSFNQILGSGSASTLGIRSGGGAVTDAPIPVTVTAC